MERTVAGVKDDSDHLEITLRQEISILRDEIRRSAQMVHQGHHTDLPGTWETCPRGVCQRAQHTLRSDRRLGRP